MGLKTKKCENESNSKSSNPLCKYKTPDVSTRLYDGDSQSSDIAGAYRSKQYNRSNTSVDDNNKNNNVFGENKDKRLQPKKMKKQKSIFRKFLSYLAVPSDHDLHQRPIIVQKKQQNAKVLSNNSSDSYINPQQSQNRKNGPEKKETGITRNQPHITKAPEKNKKNKFFNEEDFKDEPIIKDESGKINPTRSQHENIKVMKDKTIQPEQKNPAYNRKNMNKGSYDLPEKESRQQRQDQQKKKKLNDKQPNGDKYVEYLLSQPRRGSDDKSELDKEDNKLNVRKPNNHAVTNPGNKSDNEVETNTTKGDGRNFSLRRRNSSRLHFESSFINEENEKFNNKSDEFIETEKPEQPRQGFRQKAKHAKPNKNDENMHDKPQQLQDNSKPEKIRDKDIHKTKNSKPDYINEQKENDPEQSGSYIGYGLHFFGISTDQAHQQGKENGKDTDKKPNDDQQYKGTSKKPRSNEQADKNIANTKQKPVDNNNQTENNLDKNKSSCRYFPHCCSIPTDQPKYNIKGNDKDNNKSNLYKTDDNTKPVRSRNNSSKSIARQEEIQDKQKPRKDNTEKPIVQKDSSNDIGSSKNNTCCYLCGPHCCSIPTDRKRKRTEKRNDEEQYRPKNNKRIEKRYDEEKYQPKNSKQTDQIVKPERNIPNSNSKPNVRNDKFYDKQKSEHVHTGKQMKDPSGNASNNCGSCFTCCSIPTDSPEIHKKRIEKPNLDEEYQSKKEKRTIPTTQSGRNIPNRSNPNAGDEQKQVKDKNENAMNNNLNKSDKGFCCPPHCCSIPTDYKPIERTDRSKKNETDSLSYTSAESDSVKPSNSKQRGKRK